MKSRNLVVSIILAVLFNLLIKPAWVLTENGVQAQMGSNYGLYAALLSLAAILNILSDLGLNQWLTRTFANHPEKYQTELPYIFGAKFWLSIIYIPILFMIGMLFSYTFYEIFLLIILGLYQICISWTQLFRANLQAFQHFRWDSFLGIIDKIFLLSIVLVFPLYTSDLEGFAISTLISGFLSVLIGFISNYFLIGSFSINFSTKQLMPLVKLSIPFALMALLFTCNERISQVLLERIAGKEESNIYAAAFRWTSAISMFLWVVLPIFYSKFAKIEISETKQLQKLFHLGWTLVALPTLFITGWVVFYGNHLLFQFDIYSQEKTQYIYLVLQILIFTVFLNGCFNIFSTYLTATHREKQVNIALLISVIGNICANLGLIPFYGALGTSIATVFAFLIQSIGFVYLFHKYSPIAIPGLLLLKFIGLSVCYFIFIFYTKDYVDFFWNACFSGIFLLITSLGLGILSKEMLKN